jgi:hypothetical protein
MGVSRIASPAQQLDQRRDFFAAEPRRIGPLEQARRCGELKRLLPEISEKMLIQQLRALETDGIVHREAFHEVPPRKQAEAAK